MLNTSRQSLNRSMTQNPSYQPQIPAELSTMSKDALRRMRALKQLQLDELNVLSRYYEKIHEVDVEFQQRYKPVRDKRAAIVNGEYDPTDEECQLPIIHDVNPAELQKLEANASNEKVKGIPDFWLNAIRNGPHMYDLLPQDAEAIKHLRDVTIEMNASPPGYTLSFHFDENPFFTNKVLKKHYTMDIKVDPERPFDYDGPVILSSVGDKINWRQDKNLTKLESSKKRDAEGQVIKNIPSFFSFFDPNTKKLGTLSRPISMALEDEIIDDFQMGEAFRQQIIPRATLFLTGEVEDDWEDEDFYSSSEGSSSVQSGSSDEDDDLPDDPNTNADGGDDAKMVA